MGSCDPGGFTGSPFTGTIINSYIKYVDKEGEKIVKQSKFQKIYNNEKDMAPADVAENLMPRCLGLHNQGEFGLQSLISALEGAKEAAIMFKAQVHQQINSNHENESIDHIL